MGLFRYNGLVIKTKPFIIRNCLIFYYFDMIFFIKNKVMLIIFVFPVVVFAQTTNHGELYLSPNTVMSVVEEFDNKSSGDFMNDGHLVLYSHYKNDGVVTFTSKSPTGVTKLYGKSGAQNISGGVPMEWNNVEFYNQSSDPVFDLTNQVSIYGRADFFNGIVKSDSRSDILIFEKNASHINAGDLSYVDGYVKKIGNQTDFVFPVGNKEYYAYCVISEGSNPSNAYFGKYNFENSNSLFPHTKKASNIALIDQKQYWNVDKVNIADDVFLSLFINKKTTDLEIDAAPHEALHIVGWDPVQNIWVDLGGVYNDSKNEITTASKALSVCEVFTFARVVLDEGGVLADQGMSPNNDGYNDFFYIKNIEKYPDNSVEIYNRWGVKVYDKVGYDNNPATSFNGISQGRSTISKSDGLPDGVYFYVITYKDKNGIKKEIKSYLYIKK
jgi:gliding motility-associated-like protein